MEATFIHTDVPGSPTILTSYYRIFMPAKALVDAGHTIHIVQGGRQRPQGKHGEEADLIDYAQVTETVLIEREIAPDIIRQLRRAGARRIISTFDDNYEVIPKFAPHYNFWHGNKGVRLSAFVTALGMVDQVIVAGTSLSDTFGHYNPAIEVIPNFLRPDWVDESISYDRTLSKTVDVVWGGTLEHRASWEGSPVPAAMAAASRQSPTPITYHTYNHVPNRYLDDAGASYVPHDWVNFSDWPKELSQYDIGLAPLRGLYDRGRSSLKVLEYASLGIPWVATDAEPYDGCEGGILLRADGRESERWTQALYRLANDELLYAEMSQRGRAWASHFQMDENVSVYERILWPRK